MVGVLAGIFGIANAEESSILQGATMSKNEIWWKSTPYPVLTNSFIAGSYKVTTFSNIADLHNGKKEFVIYLLSAK